MYIQYLCDAIFINVFLDLGVSFFFIYLRLELRYASKISIEGSKFNIP